MFDHASLSADVLFYIDEMVNFGDTLKVKGWFAHKYKKIKSIIIDGNEIDCAITKRQDVKSVYPSLPSNEVGVEFTISRSDVTKPLGLMLEDSSTVNNIGSLEKSYIRLSGFANVNSGLTIVDNFYKDPDAVRSFAIKNLNFKPSGYHKGQRSDRFILDGTKEIFEKILGRKVLNWNHPEYANGVFQFCAESDPIVYHVDTQQYAGIVFLTPDAPLRTGTGTYKSRITGATRFNREEMSGEKFNATFKAGGSELNFYDNSTLDLVDGVANVYNRLVIWDARTIHAAEKYFGDSIENSRFFHLFFFDLE